MNSMLLLEDVCFITLSLGLLFYFNLTALLLTILCFPIWFLWDFCVWVCACVSCDFCLAFLFVLLLCRMLDYLFLFYLILFIYFFTYLFPNEETKGRGVRWARKWRGSIFSYWDSNNKNDVIPFCHLLILQSFCLEEFSNTSPNSISSSFIHGGLIISWVYISLVGSDDSLPSVHKDSFEICSSSFVVCEVLKA